jgi:hypothetical protein
MDPKIKFFVERIKNGKTTLDRVPAKLREEVEKALNN